MDSGSQPPRRSKRMFKPRPQTPSSRRPITPIINTEAEEEENRKVARQLAKRIGIGRGRTKTEPKASAEVAFQPNSSSVGIRSFGVTKEDDNRGFDDVKESPSLDIVPVVSSGTSRNDGEEDHTLVTRAEGDYVEPWDYEHSYYPTVLPLRKPYSGDPELLDQEEFGEVAKHPDYDESMINSAKELGLTSEQHCKKQMFFFKVPDCLPIEQLTEANTKRSASDNSKRSNPFEGLPEGLMGKMLVYKSGAVKMKLGDVLFDVSPGPNTKIHNDVAVIDTEQRNCCRVGSSAKFVTVTPDIESLLNSASEMEIQK